MNAVGFFECLVLVAFWLGGLAAYLIGGMIWLGWVAELLLWTAFGWAAYRVWLTIKEEILDEIERAKAFDQWGKRRNKRVD